VLGVGVNTVKYFREILVANQIFLFGYPTSIGIKKNPEIDYLRPLLRTGIIAGINDQKKTIILDCPVNYGNSGGPVLEVEEDGFARKFRVIGVVSKFVPAVEVWENKTHRYHYGTITNSGYSIVIPMDFVMELIRQF
jgi:hypothetical protein